MLSNAITKVRSEMGQNKNNSYIHAVGGLLLQHLETNPGSAEKILDAEKTIGKSLDAMRKEAEKKRSGNYAVLTDQEGFAAVLKYYGIEGSAAAPAPSPVPQAVPVEQKPVPKDEFNISLEDLL